MVPWFSFQSLQVEIYLTCSEIASWCTALWRSTAFLWIFLACRFNFKPAAFALGLGNQGGWKTLKETDLEEVSRSTLTSLSQNLVSRKIPPNYCSELLLNFHSAKSSVKSGRYGVFKLSSRRKGRMKEDIASQFCNVHGRNYLIWTRCVSKAYPINEVVEWKSRERREGDRENFPCIIHLGPREDELCESFDSPPLSFLLSDNLEASRARKKTSRFWPSQGFLPSVNIKWVLMKAVFTRKLRITTIFPGIRFLLSPLSQPKEHLTSPMRQLHWFLGLRSKELSAMGARRAPSTCSWFPFAYISWRLCFRSNGTHICCPFPKKLITPKPYLFRESKRRCKESEGNRSIRSPGTATGTLRTASDLAVVLRGTAEPHHQSCWPPLTLGVIRGTFHSASFDGLFFDHQNFHVEMRQCTQKILSTGLLRLRPGPLLPFRLLLQQADVQVRQPQGT